MICQRPLSFVGNVLLNYTFTLDMLFILYTVY